MDVIGVAISFLGISAGLVVLYYQLLLRISFEFHRGRSFSNLHGSKRVIRAFVLLAGFFFVSAVGMMVAGTGMVIDHPFFAKWAMVPAVAGMTGIALFLRKLTQVT